MAKGKQDSEQASLNEDLLRIASSLENGNTSNAVIEELREIAEKVKSLEK